jgi:ABC-type nitrate/sulfonate/bicarbonate transport system ATPase subunit
LNISRYYKGEAGSKKFVFENLNFTIKQENQITSILTPFSKGKTTLLRILSGLDDDYTGIFLVKGKKLYNKLPFIPEKPASFPWLNVSGNIKLILAINRKKDEISHIQLQDIINLVGLEGYEDHFPHNISYGFRFRISLARALAVSPEIILLDDPFKQMDSETKNELLILIKKISVENNIKFLMASSNITDVAILSDIILLFNGKLDGQNRHIIVPKYENRIETVRNQVQEILLKEDISNSSGFSV